MTTDKRSEILKMAADLMRQHGLFEPEQNYRLAWNRRAKRIYGQCDTKRKLIFISEKLAMLNPIETTRTVVLHEIAHALTPKHGHDKVWRDMCIKIGGDGKRTYDSYSVVRVPARYESVCPSCGVKSHRHKKPTCNHSCGKCDPKHFNLKFLLRWRDTKTGRLLPKK